LGATVASLGCEEPLTPQADVLQADIGAHIAPNFHVGCPGGLKFTGGGRIDVDGEVKWTFGFNLHATDECSEDIKGQMEVNHHPSQTKFHSTEWTHYASFEVDGGLCVEWRGIFRAKHGNGPWHEHTATGSACDYGEPGSSPGTGPDTFRFNSFGGNDEGPHANTHRTPLTGGNIQAH
jgi:hypothetical protein